MVTGLLGKKLGTTRIFTEDGRWLHVTLLETGPCVVVQRKSGQKDKYEAVQVGFGAKEKRKCNKPELGHLAKAGVEPVRVLREFLVDASSELKAGDQILVDIFAAGERVDVTGTSKGRGFAGIHKRHHMKGGPASHGSMFHRAVGSIGSSADPSRVFKGQRMPGHMGDKGVTVQGLMVVRVDAEKNLLVVQGCVPGPNGALVQVKKSVKGSK